MNAERIIVEIRFAGINQSFDFVVPRDICGGDLCREALALVKQTIAIDFGDYENAALIAEKSGKLITVDSSLDNAGVDSGDILYIV